MGSLSSVSPLSLPFAVMTASFLVVMVMAALTRGQPLIRIGLALICLSSLPYAVGLTISMSVRDPAVSHVVAKGLVGGVGLVGPSLMFTMLADTGRLERYRWLVTLAFAIAIAAALITFTTDAIVSPHMWKTPLGFWFHRAKPFDGLVIAQLPFWGLIGYRLSGMGKAGPRSARQARVRRGVLMMLILAVLAVSDALLAHGHGIYPFGVIPGTAAVWVVLVAIRKQDLLHARGFDTAALIELGLGAAALVAASLGLWWLAGHGLSKPWLVALTLAPVLAVVQLLALFVRRRFREATPAASDAEIQLEEYVDLTGRLDDEEQLVAPLTELLAAHASLPGASLWMLDPEGHLAEVGGDRNETFDPRLKPWLVANREPLVFDELATKRLGGLREPIERFLGALRGEVLAPLVDRDALVGVIVGAPPDGRALRASQLSVLAQAARATAKAITYVSLFREAAARVEVAKEVEVATAVQQARSAGEQSYRFGDCEVVGYYQPATQFGGHWWTASELDDGRFAVVLGDVTGSGVSAALVSFTAEGACETARLMYGASVEVVSLLQMLDASVSNVGGERHTMSCFAAIFDPENRRVTFANAGHPFPYVCRRPANGGPPTLRSLVSRGTPLGTEPLVLSASTFELEPGDTVFFYSDSVVEIRGPEGEVYGDRRLQRLLKARAAGGDLAVQSVLGDVMDFLGDRGADDDLNLISVRVG